METTAHHADHLIALAEFIDSHYPAEPCVIEGGAVLARLSWVDQHGNQIVRGEWVRTFSEARDALNY
jgi:hypothetical protein